MKTQSDPGGSVQRLVRHSSTRHIVLEVAERDADGVTTIASVTFCESSASLQIGDITVHIPWSELAAWQAWLAMRVETGEDA